MKKNKNILNKIDSSKPIVITQEILNILSVGDWVFAQYNDEVMASDHGSEAYFSFEIFRKVEETNAEKKKRKISELNQIKISRKRRLATYLKLKKEFEDL